jgi:hypothetical protein
VEIDAQDPAQLRGAVLARMSQLGGIRIGETTSFTGAGASELRFRIPTTRLEEAMVALDSLGGNVTSQSLDLSGLADRATTVESGVADLQTCLDGVAGALRVNPADATERLASCQTTASRVGNEIDGASLSVDESELEVRIAPSTSSNPVLVAAILLLLAAAVGLSVMVWRAAKAKGEVDLRDIDDFGQFDDPFLRRN